jgi:hypothetical protein
MHDHSKKERWHKWKQAFEDDSMPAEERIRLLEEKKGFLVKKLEKIEALLSELKK